MSFVLLLLACAAGSGGPAASSPGPAGSSGPAGASAGQGAAAPVASTLGTVHAGAPDVWYVVPDGEAGTRYCVGADHAAVRVEGQRVRFAGVPGEIPPNVRLACTPFEFSELEPA